MFLYNTTFAIDEAIEQDFIKWLKEEFVPAAVVDDGEYFSAPEVMRVLHTPEPGTANFAVHLRAADRDNIEKWYADHGSRLFADLINRWNGRIAYFSTVLELL